MNHIRLLKRFSSALNDANNIILEHLSHREIVRVKGPEVAQFLQGLITNDMNHISEGHLPCMYTMFLNTKGRILHDGIVYSTRNPDTYLIECDCESAQAIEKHLKMYRIRRKIDVEALGSEYKIWVVFDKSSSTFNELSKPLIAMKEQFACPCSDPKKPVSKQNDIHVFRDPRLAALGLRFITQENFNHDTIGKILGLPSANKQTSANYRTHRYRLGIGEGCKDLPPEACFPLEANGDYLHAVSFNKGCYLGQELTARTYHTGVIRKRLMPLYLENEFPSITNNDVINISNETKASVGKLRGVDGTTGLALLRIAPALAAQKLDVNGIASKTQKPEWWPKETKTSI